MQGADNGRGVCLVHINRYPRADGLTMLRAAARNTAYLRQDEKFKKIKIFIEKFTLTLVRNSGRQIRLSLYVGDGESVYK